MKRGKIKLSKKVLVISILISLILLASMIVYALDAWNQGYRLDQETITIHYGDAGGTSSPTASCYSLTNTNANDYFIPTKTSGEMSSFINHKPAGVTSASALVDEYCSGSWSCSVSCASQDKCSGIIYGTYTCSSCTEAQCGGTTTGCDSINCAQTCTSADCASGKYCNYGLCTSCTGYCSSYADTYLCGQTFLPPSGCSGICTGTGCPSASSVPCGTTYTGCGCAVGGSQCSSGTCNYCSTSPGCGQCSEGTCEYDYGQYYCG